MSDFLQRMVASSRRRGSEARDIYTEAKLRAEPGAGTRKLRLSDQGFDVIAEVKLRSPASGEFDTYDSAAMAARAARYERAGAVAISVLTEPTEFNGSLEHVRTVREATSLPVLRKDFLVEPYQALEARSAGADGILLIVKILEDQRLAEMISIAHDLDMFVLVESFDADDVQRMKRIQGLLGEEDLIGLNCRDLRTLEVDFDRFQSLAAEAGVPMIAESGISDPGRAAAVAQLGYRGALVGSALMESEDPEGALRELIAGGRRESAA